jgi:glycerate 2-kinase
MASMPDDVRARLLRILRAAIAAADPSRLISAALDGTAAGAGAVPASIDSAARIYVLAIGKAARAMSSELERRLGARLAGGLVVAPPGAGRVQLAPDAAAPLAPESSLHVVIGGHPLPDAGSERAARAALALLQDAGRDDLVIVALSGGASAMFAAPAPGLALDEKIAVTGAMLRAGAPISELNAVRKHLSAVKGGRLVQACNGARVIGLILSDVAGNDPATIGSGPTAPDPTTFADAISILKHRRVWGRAPERVRDFLERGNAREVPETPKADDPAFERVTNVIIGDNGVALDAAGAAARAAGFAVRRARELSGEADDLGRALAAELAGISGDRVCVLSGGEAVVTVRGGGRGGRAQQCALSLALELDRIAPARRIAALVAGTDGIDGPTDAAGAFASPATVARAAAAGLDAAASLRRNDAYNLFDALGDLVRIGPTGTNVADLLIALVNW